MLSHRDQAAVHAVFSAIYRGITMSTACVANHIRAQGDARHERLFIARTELRFG